MKSKTEKALKNFNVALQKYCDYHTEEYVSDELEFLTGSLENSWKFGTALKNPRKLFDVKIVLR